MAVLNAARWLPDQLGSLARQSFDDWLLRVADDGSDDTSRDLIRAFAETCPPGRVTLEEGPGQGAAANFLTLLQGVAPGHGAAYSDQDDVWHPEKLATAAKALAPLGDRPAVWACRLMRVDADLRPLGPTKSPDRGASFGNALVENILSGNATVLNPAGVEALRPHARAAIAAGVPVHDWWTYQVMTGIGGEVLWEQTPLVNYRQHGGNLIGAQGGARAALARIRRLREGTFRRWLDANGRSLAEVPLTAEARATAQAFEALRRGPARRMPRGMAEAGILRQGRRDDWVLSAAARLGLLSAAGI